MSERERSTLVRLPAWIGDAVCALPLLEAIAAARSSSPLLVLARGETKEIVASLPFVRYVLVEPYPMGPRALPETAALVRRLRAERIGDAFVLAESLLPLVLLRMAGARRAYRLGRRSRTGWLTEVRRTPGHLLDQYAALARAAGVSVNAREPRLDAGEEDRARVRDVLRAAGLPHGDLTLLAPGASYGDAKRWPAESFATVAARLAVHGAAVAVVGGEKDRALADRIVAHAGEGVVSLAGRTDLRQLIALCGEADQVIGNDSGPLHVAAAAGAHTIGVYGSTDPAWTAPRSARHVSVSDPPHCSPCFQRACAFGAPCLARVDPEAVIERARERIGARGRERGDPGGGTR